MSFRNASWATLTLPEPLRRRIELPARARYPHEACGLLIGSVGDRGVEVAQLADARNMVEDRPHDRYEIDPADFLTADRAARAAGLEVVGFWHSHPDGSARPSSTDRDAAWHDYAYLIAAVSAQGMGELRGWRVSGDAFVEVALAPCPQ